ncbi:iron complex transport system permease protein [Tamaricihabitans halophyticus]|uniref:Iron complex transport system permease protein n=1 Tax=Tamaricihabitans halophyticus TaxID=1262583 RepID=A0A4R2R2I4_9PSEU|nr:iron ABC transporter permease [Tamaricihabitans halophyticus]TCP53645.1 iron complex transport system permease protein [Tamaricihabitans halophyticus]
MTANALDRTTAGLRRAADPPRSGGRLLPLVIGLVVLLACSVLAGIALGPVNLPLSQVLRILDAEIRGGVIPASEEGPYRIITQLRLPRVLLGAIVGAGLATVGVAVQACVRNALADPYILGISSGASVGATAVTTLGIFAGLGLYALSVAAFLSALVATALVYLAANGRSGLTPLRLVLTGTAMAYGFSAITTLLVFRAPHGEAARSALFWLLGSLAGANWASVPIAGIVVLLGIGYFAVRARRLNALSMGDEAAITLGVHATRFRRELFAVSAALTGVLVAVSGAIGFVGLLLPHVVRMLVGADHRRVLAIAPLAGACFLVWVDLAARTLAAPEELPIGVLTAVLGVPFFVLLMRRRGYVFGGR